MYILNPRHYSLGVSTFNICLHQLGRLYKNDDENPLI